MARKLIIFGLGNVAELADYYLTDTHQYEVVAFTVDDEYVGESRFLGRPVIASSELTATFPADEYSLFLALAYGRLNALRMDKFLWAKEHKYHLPSFISPKCTYLSNYPVGENCFILEDNTVQPFVRIGNNVTLWSGNHIGHHSVIRDHAFLASQIVVSGGVSIGERSFVGVNATLRDHITIGARSIIGAGTLVLADTAEDSVYVGARTAPREMKSDMVTRI